jgi:hypothetical protein
MLTLLDCLVEHVAEQGADSSAQQAARDVMRYSDNETMQHAWSAVRVDLQRVAARRGLRRA